MDKYLYGECFRLPWKTRLLAVVLGVSIGAAIVTAVGFVVCTLAP